MEKPGKTRRQFVATLIAALAGLLFLKSFLSPRLRKQPERLRLTKGELPAHGALVYRQARMAIIRDAASLYALELICTHLGCTVSVTPGDLVCPCHGSRFDREGKVLTGPADRPLKRYAVQEDESGFVVLLS